MLPSRATRRKHILRSADDDELPTGSQTVVKVTALKGNHLFDVTTADGDSFVASLPMKFRRTMWIQRNGYVLIEPIPEGNKVKGEIVKILSQDNVKWYRENSAWPAGLEDPEPAKGDDDCCDDEDDDDLLLRNPNRPQTDTDGSDDDSDLEDAGSDDDNDSSAEESDGDAEQDKSGND